MPRNPGYQPLKLLGILFIEGYSQQHQQSLQDAISDELQSCEPHEQANIQNNQLLQYIATVYNLRMYNTIVDHSVATNTAIASVANQAMGLLRSLATINNSAARAAIESHNQIHAFYEKHSRQINEAADSNDETIHRLFLDHIKHHSATIEREDRRINATFKALAYEHEALSPTEPSKRVNSKGPAKYLP